MTARKHHYVPQFYLRGFTTNDDIQQPLWVLDQPTGRQWESRPAGIAFENNLYRVEAPGVEPDVVERKFAEFEGQADQVLKDIIRTQRLPEGERFDTLLNFVAFSAVRIPAWKNRIAGFSEEALKMAARLTVETPERWASVLQRLRQAGEEVPEISYEEMKEFIEGNDYDIEFPVGWFIKHLIDGVKTILPLLAQRNWVLAIANDGEFICSDRPVALVWSAPVPTFWGPGFGMENTELTMPLTRKLALIARFTPVPPELEANSQTVATINSRTGQSAERHVYSAHQDFAWLKKDGTLGNAADLIRLIQTSNTPPPAP